jgi:hypothetical protein
MTYRESNQSLSDHFKLPLIARWKIQNIKKIIGLSVTEKLRVILVVLLILALSSWHINTDISMGLSLGEIKD